MAHLRTLGKPGQLEQSKSGRLVERRAGRYQGLLWLLGLEGASWVTVAVKTELELAK